MILQSSNDDSVKSRSRRSPRIHKIPISDLGRRYRRRDLRDRRDGCLSTSLAVRAFFQHLFPTALGRFDRRGGDSCQQRGIATSDSRHACLALAECGLFLARSTIGQQSEKPYSRFPSGVETHLAKMRRLQELQRASAHVQTRPA